MSSPAVDTTAAARPEPGAPRAEAAPAGGGGVMDLLRVLWGDARGSVYQRVHLLLLELRLAGLTLVQLVIYAVVVAVLVVTAWIGLMGGLVVSLISAAGLHWAVALGIGVALNLAVAALLVGAMYKLVERVGLPASLRQLEGKKAQQHNDTPHQNNTHKQGDEHAAKPAEAAGT